MIPAGSYDNFDWGFRYNTDRSAKVFMDGRIDWGGFYTGRRIGTNSTVNYRFEDRFVASFRVACPWSTTSTRASTDSIALDRVVTSCSSVPGKRSRAPRGG